MIIRTKMFGALYAQGREEYSYGNVVSVKGNMVKVLYDEDNVEWKSHATHLTDEGPRRDDGIHDGNPSRARPKGRKDD